MGGATDFKVGYKTGFASGASERKIFVPPLFQMYKQANISRGLLNILKFAVDGCRINKHICIGIMNQGKRQFSYG